MLAASMAAAGTTGTETPPGITALSCRPFHTPPARSSRSLNGIPRGNSMLHGLATCPDREKIMVPPEFGGPKPANHAAPLRMVVGLPYSPKPAGNGGLNRGLPGLPSSDSSSAVSSPQM